MVEAKVRSKPLKSPRGNSESIYIQISSSRNAVERGFVHGQLGGEVASSAVDSDHEKYLMTRAMPMTGAFFQQLETSTR